MKSVIPETLRLETFQERSADLNPMVSECEYLSGGFDNYVNAEVEQRKLDSLIRHRNPRILRRITLTERTGDLQELVIQLDGVLGFRSHESGGYVWREGVRQGLQLIRQKVGGNLRVSLLVTVNKASSFNRLLRHALYEEFKIGEEGLVDEVIIVKMPDECTGQLEYPRELFAGGDRQSKQLVMWVLPVPVENSELTDLLKKPEKPIGLSPSMMPPFENTYPHFTREDYLFLVSDLTFEQHSTIAFTSLAKAISSLFLLGQVPLQRAATIPAAVPIIPKENKYGFQVVATISPRPTEQKLMRQLSNAQQQRLAYSWLKSY